MALEDLILPGIVGIFVLVIAVWIIGWRTIVELKFVDVVVRKSGTSIYSADSTIEGSQGAVYYAVPSWIPIWGLTVKRMPLEILQIKIEGYDTFAKANARFNIDVSIYCRIKDVRMAAQRFPGNNIEDFKKGMAGIVVSVIRKITANYAIEDIIAKRQEIGDGIRDEILQDLNKWGIELTNVAVENISDAKDTTVIQDISAKKEAEINSLSRQTIAQQKKAADVIEAENREFAEKRKIEADEQIALRAQVKDKTIAVAEQEAVTKQLEVTRAQKVTGANIDAEAKIKAAEGTRQSQIIVAEGEKQALVLNGDGEASKNKAIGLAAADVVQATKIAEATGLSALADAQAKQQNNAKEIRLIEKDQIVGLAVAEALRNAHIEYIGSGNPENLMDLFKVGGGMSAGASLGTAMKMIKRTDPELHEKIINAVGSIGGKEIIPTIPEEAHASPNPIDSLNPDNVGMILEMLKASKPDVYKVVKDSFVKKQ